MSTSPSWFDQEKFSRLVKKVGPKGSATPPAPATSGRAVTPRPPEKETRRLQRSLGEVERSTSAEPEADTTLPQPERSAAPLISIPDGPIRATTPEPGAKESEPGGMNFPSPMPVPEPRSVSPLAKRTTPLPNLKSIFEYEQKSERKTAASQPLPGRPHLTPAPIIFEEEPAPEEAVKDLASKEDVPALAELPEQPEFPRLKDAPEVAAEMTVPWQAFSPLAEAGKGEPATPQASDELDELFKERAELLAKVEELSHKAGEGDAVRAEAELLRHQLQQADEILRATGIPDTNHEELARTTEERDNARRDYANLREEFERLKAEQGGGRRGAFGQEAARFGREMTPAETPAKPSELDDAVKAQVAGLESTIANLKKELDAVQGQIGQSRDETSVAQRGLALSQRALQETRDALREAHENSAQSKASVESLKNECSSLVQQNLALQAQNDQLARELSSMRAKPGNR